MANNFSNIIDYNFTASVEDDFDSIASGEKDWQSIIDSFYNPFNKKVDDVSKNAKRETGERILGEDPKTGRQLSVKLGKFGPIAQIGKNDDEENVSSGVYFYQLRANVDGQSDYNKTKKMVIVR